MTVKGDTILCPLLLEITVEAPALELGHNSSYILRFVTGRDEEDIVSINDNAIFYADHGYETAIGFDDVTATVYQDRLRARTVAVPVFIQEPGKGLPAAKVRPPEVGRDREDFSSERLHQRVVDRDIGH